MILDKETYFTVRILANLTSKFLPCAASRVLIKDNVVFSFSSSNGRYLNLVVPFNSCLLYACYFNLQTYDGTLSICLHSRTT